MQTAIPSGTEGTRGNKLPEAFLPETSLNPQNALTGAAVGQSRETQGKH